MFFDPIILFFVAGILIKGLFRSLHVPPLVNQVISFFVLVTIGLKGGIELCAWSCTRLAVQMAGVLMLSIALYYFAKFFLFYIARYSKQDACVVAAHYGSVSVTTFAVGLSILNQYGISFEPYMPLFVGLMELPAVIAASVDLDRLRMGKTSVGANILRALSCKSVLTLVLGIAVGFFAGSALLPVIKPLFFDTFRAVLALLLLEMGVLVGDEFSLIKRQALQIAVVAVSLSIGCSILGLIAGILIGLSQGGTMLLMLLAASASYIAVPAVLRQQNPSGSISFALGHALGVTFPFNIFIGMYLYIALVQAIYIYM